MAHHNVKDQDLLNFIKHRPGLSMDRLNIAFSRDVGWRLRKFEADHILTVRKFNNKKHYYLPE
jgi:hypothetical protein